MKTIEEIWAGDTPAQRNTRIGVLMGADPIHVFYLCCEGKILWRILCDGTEVEDRRKTLVEIQESDRQWKAFLMDNAAQISAGDRGKLSIEDRPYHIRYSETPGGGWDVIEHLRKKDFTVDISSAQVGWEVVINKPFHCFSHEAPTLAEAACILALKALS